jgi:hypothetical protein
MNSPKFPLSFQLVLIAITAIICLGSTTPAQAFSFASPVFRPAQENPRGDASADFNGDGKPDLAVANYGSGSVSVMLNGPNMLFSPTVNYAVGSAPWALICADINLDGQQDIITSNHNSNSVSILYGNGDGTFLPQVSIPVGTVPHGVFAGDLDGDGDIDLAVANAYNNNVRILLNNGSQNFILSGTITVGDTPQIMTGGDFDGDGDLDLAVTNEFSNNVAIIINSGNGTFSPSVFYSVGSSPWCICTADWDADGDLDLATANYRSDNISVLKNNGDGTFVTQVTYSAGSYPEFIAAADLDGDGDQDLVAANAISNSVSVYGNHGNGVFNPGANFTAGNLPVSVCVADFDMDGSPDLATSCHGGANAAILINNLVLPPVGTISGTVMGYTIGGSIPIVANVFAYIPNGSNPTASVNTGANGHYSLNLPYGSYQILSQSDGFESLWYDNTTEREQATVLTVDAGSNPTNINFLLFPPPTPPEPFALYLPTDGSREVAYYTTFIWGLTADANLNSSFSYTIEFSFDGTFDSSSYRITGISDTSIAVLTDSIVQVGTNSYWRVLAVDNDGLSRLGGIPEEARQLKIFPVGDANSSQSLTGLDVIYLVNYFHRGGSAPDPILSGDVNRDCEINGEDVLYLVNYFKGLVPQPLRADCQLDR